MAQAKCQECGNEWNLSKSLSEYSSGPRCSECGSYEIDTESGPQGSEAAVVFDALAAEKALTEIVREENIAPDRVEDLAKQYGRLDGLVLRSSDEIEKIREEQYEKGYETGYEEGYEEAEEEFGKGLI